MECRLKCGACCISISISSFIPGHPSGKAAGVPCKNLDEELNCLLFNDPSRPTVCKNLKSNIEMCGNSREEAMRYLSNLEKETSSI